MAYNYLSNLGSGGGVSSATLPLVLTGSVLSVNSATTSDRGVVILDDNYQDAPSSSKAATTNFVVDYVESQISNPTSNVTFNALKLNASTNMLQLGSGGTYSTTVTMATLGANRTFSLPNENSNSVQGLNAPVANKFVQYVDGQGFQTLAYPNLSSNITSDLAAGLITSAGSGAAISSIAYSANSGTSNVMSRDSSGNSYANNLKTGYTNNTSGVSFALTAASPYWTDITGGMSVTVTLPSGTTLTNGTQYRINNASSITSTVTIAANGGTILGYLPIGFYADLVLTNNGTSAGVWDILISAANFASVNNVATNDGNITFGMDSNPNQICNPSAGRTYTLLGTNVPIGYPRTFTNRSAYRCLINSGNGETIGYMYPYGSVNVIANVATPTTAANWTLVNVGNNTGVTTLPISVSSFANWTLVSPIYILVGSGSTACNVYGATGLVPDLMTEGRSWTIYNNSSCAMTFYDQSSSATGQQFFLGGVSQFTLPAATPNAFVTFINMTLGVTRYWVLTNTNCSKLMLAKYTSEAVQAGYLLENVAVSYSVTTSSFGVWFDGTGVTLSPGKWLLTHLAQQYGGTYQWASIALTTFSGNNGSGQVLGKNQLLMPNVTSVQYTSGTITVPPVDVSVSTIYYAKIIIANGSSSSVTCMGTLIAIRLP
jgi:hypothetical protein